MRDRRQIRRVYQPRRTAGHIEHLLGVWEGERGGQSLDERAREFSILLPVGEASLEKEEGLLVDSKC